MVYAIDKNIAVPSTTIDITPYPFANMVVGDSFLVPFPTGVTSAGKVSLQQTVAKAANYHARTVTPRRTYITQITSTGIRCWRTTDIVVPNTIGA